MEARKAGGSEGARTRTRKGIIKVCLDDACTRYYLTSDGKVIAVPKDTCDLESTTDNFKRIFIEMARNARETIYTDRDPGWKVGDEAILPQSGEISPEPE